MPDQQEQDVVDDQLLAALAARPEWEALRRRCERRMDGHFRRLARLFATEGQELDYARLQFQRGVFAGMKFLLDAPAVEAKKLERLLENDTEVTEGA
jgi:hypothetical protein